MKLSNLTIGGRVWLAFGLSLATIALLVGVVEINLTRSVAVSEAAATDAKLKTVSAELQLLAKDNAVASLSMLLSPSTQ